MGWGTLKGRGRPGVWRADACEGHGALQITGRILGVSCWLLSAEETPNVLPSCGRGDCPRPQDFLHTHCLLRRYQAHSSDPLIPESQNSKSVARFAGSVRGPGALYMAGAVKGSCTRAFVLREHQVLSETHEPPTKDQNCGDFLAWRFSHPAAHLNPPEML